MFRQSRVVQVSTVADIRDRRYPYEPRLGTVYESMIYCPVQLVLLEDRKNTEFCSDIFRRFFVTFVTFVTGETTATARRPTYGMTWTCLATDLHWRTRLLIFFYFFDFRANGATS